MTDAKPTDAPSSGGKPNETVNTKQYQYTGQSGAIRLAAHLFVVIATVAVVTGGTLLLLGGNAVNRQLVLGICVRMAILGGCVAVASAIAMVINNGRREKLLSSHHAGESGAVLGVIAALWLSSTFVIPGPNPAAAANPAKTESGGSVVAFSGETTDGRVFDISEMRGKVVLVDFWATWCGPCVASLPEVLAIHDAYHDAGFEIIGVSLDLSETELQDFVAAKGIPWLQLLPSKKKERGWSHPLVGQFNVDGIPRMMLIGKDGKMISDEIYPDELDAAVSQALGISAGRVRGGAALRGGGSRGLLVSTIFALIAVLVHGALWLVAPMVLLGGVLGGIAERLIRGSPQKQTTSG